MSSRQPPMPSLRTREDANPPRLPQPTAEDTKPDIRTAMFSCEHDKVVGTRRGRNLIVNIDGTSNQFSVNSTNVVELFSRIIKIGGEVEQLVFYNSGIGTYARPSFRSFSYLKQVIYNHIDTAIAWNFEKIIHAAYKWLSENYQPGDRIFLFGFSRGAYQVRVIAGMIEKVGLLHKGNENQIPFAYELYTALKAHTRASTATPPSTEASEPASNDSQQQPQASESEEEKLCRSFKRSLCHKDVKVHFVGVWDTVSSIGIFRGQSFPETVSGMGHVCHFRHALALDERRAKFQPEYVNGGLGPIEGSNRGDVKEVWFKGTHSDIGGGNTKNENLNNFTDSLRWMTYEAQFWGLYIEPYKGNWIPVTPKESLTLFWLPLEYLPFGSLSYETQDGLTWSPIVDALDNDEQANVDISIPGAFPEPIDRTDDTANAVPSEAPPKLDVYRPKAEFHPSLQHDWDQMFSAFAESGNLPIIEQDPFENASHTLISLSHACDILTNEQGDKERALNTISVDIQTLQSFLDHDARRASLLEVPNAAKTLLQVLVAAVRLQSFATSPEAKLTLIRLLANASPTQHPLPMTSDLRPSSAEVFKWGISILCTTHRDDFFRALQPFACLRHHQQGSSSIWNVAFSRLDPTNIIFTSHPHFGHTTSTWTWDGSTHKEITVIQGEYSTISRDGSHIAVENGEDVSIIDATTQPPSTAKCTDDEDFNDSGNISSLCFSTDNHTLATGHENGWIKLWRREGDQWKVGKRFKGGDSIIHSLAFSRDGSQLVFNSNVGTIKVWNLADNAVIELEDSRYSASLAWSPSGDRIVSGTGNGSVEIWSANRGKITHTFKAHNDWIDCLAFRDDGQVLATGSWDHRIRIWQCNTWEKIWEFDIGEEVLSLAFSPDGKRLVSGGRWGVLHLWDVDMGDDEHVD
ncbi:hypothetical protein ONZ45_g15306 [Pleurotus djamor]|nr:hypothetical protein ONZ45_g15306 [Pleurotus djamor]